MKSLTALFFIIATTTLLSGCQTKQPDLCQQLTGQWQGVYHDPTGLFPNTDFPINLTLQYHAPYLVGYTLPSQDAGGARFGTNSPYLFSAVCHNNQLSHVTLLKTPHQCGGRTHHITPIKNNKIISFPLHWENAMTSTAFIATLKKSSTTTQMNARYIHNALLLAQQIVKTCH